MRRQGTDRRGSNKDRARRKQWLLDAFGNGVTVRCVHGFPGCVGKLTYASVEADRIIPGGTYARTNIQPSCGPCNRRRSNRPELVTG
jgi:hypothetical protein